MNEGRATFAEVERVFGRIRLVKSGSLLLPLSKDGVEDLPAAEDPTVENSQGPMLSRAGRAAVIIGLPRNVLLLRFLELPNVDDAALPGLVSYELDRHLPFPPEEAYYTFQKLRQQGNTAQVLLVAARRVDVKRAIEQVEQLGLTPTGVDVSAIAATNALFFRNQNWTDKVLILIEVIEGEATVNLVNEGMLVSSRTVPFTDDSFSPLFSELKRVSETVPQTLGHCLCHCRHKCPVLSQPELD